MIVQPISSKDAAAAVVAHHYLHRKPQISFAYGLQVSSRLAGVVTFGVPASRHLQLSVCRQDPGVVIELNRLWVSDEQPRNTESWFLARVLALMPAHIIVSYADTAAGHVGYVYRASNFRYAGWTDMERKTPRFDYVPVNGGHSRNAFRSSDGWSITVRRKPKVKYWTVTGSAKERKRLRAICGWLDLDWRDFPPPTFSEVRVG